MSQQLIDDLLQSLFVYGNVARMKVLVCGGRTYSNRQRVYEVLDEIDRRRRIDRIVHGRALGSDELADGWARSRHRFVLQFPVKPEDWRTFGPRAGPMRNQRMLEEGKPDLVVAFPGSRGTADMIRRARAAGVECVLVDISHESSRPAK